MAVAPWIVSDELWERGRAAAAEGGEAVPLPGRKRVPDREALQGILFVLNTGIAWRHLPLELGFGGGSTCYRRMDEWQRAGVWERLHEQLLAELRAAGEIEWAWAVADGSHVQAKKGAPRRARARWIGARKGSKHHLLVDGTGLPLAWRVSGGNRNDVTQLIPLVDRVPASGRKVGRPRRRPDRVTADRGYGTTSTDANSDAAASPQKSLAARPSTAPGSAASAGSSSAPSPGCITSSVCWSATTAARKSTRRSSPSVAASSASGGFRTHCDSILSQMARRRPPSCRAPASSRAVSRHGRARCPGQATIAAPER